MENQTPKTEYGKVAAEIIEKYQATNPNTPEILREHSELMGRIYEIHKKQTPETETEQEKTETKI